MDKLITSLKMFYWRVEQKLYFYHIKRKALAIDSINKQAVKQDIIVSLTSYPKRYPTLLYNVKSLLLQDCKPEQLILWIAEDDAKQLPDTVLQLAKDIEHFSIQICENIRSFKKIIPALKQYPDKHIVTADDDVIYPQNWLSTLLESWSGKSKEVVAHRAHKVLFVSGEQTVAPYKQWSSAPANCDDAEIFQTGIGGVLYPAYSLHSQVTHVDTFMQLCPTADDIWLFWMARLQGSKIITTQSQINIVTLPGTDEGGLAEENVAAAKNDQQIHAMIKHFGWPTQQEAL